MAADRSLQGLGLCISLQYPHSKISQKMTDTKVVVSARGPNT